MDVWLLSSISLPTSDKSRNMPHHSLGTLQQGFCIAPASESFLQDLHLRARWHLLLLLNSVKQSYDLRVVALPHRLDTYDISEGMVDKENHTNYLRNVFRWGLENTISLSDVPKFGAERCRFITTGVERTSLIAIFSSSSTASGCCFMLYQLDVMVCMNLS